MESLKSGKYEDNPLTSRTIKAKPHRIINEDTPDIPPKDQMSTWIDEQIIHYERMGHRDELLWEDFRADFARWQPDDFRNIPQRKRGELRSFLRNNGVYVTTTEVIPMGLSNLMEEEEPAEWPKEELIRISNASVSFNSWKNPNLKEKLQMKDKPYRKSELLNLLPVGTKEQQTSPNFQQIMSSEPSQPGSRQEPMPAFDPGRGIQILSKIYLKEDKYSGAEDILDIKLRMFYANCFTAGVGQADYPAAFSTMLIDEARKFYFTKIAGRQSSFDDVIRMIKAEFETEQRQERITTEWEDARLEDFRGKHPDKTLLEVFDIMRRQLIHQQGILRPELQSDSIIRDKLYRACRNVPECNMALFKRSNTFQEASEDLRNCLAIQSQIGIPHSLTMDTREDESSTVFYADRKYQGKSTRHGEYLRGSGSRSSSKKCFICKKLGCWSTNHPDDERKRVFQRFKGEKWSNDKFRQYVIEFEGLDPDTSKEYEQFIDELEIENNENIDHSSQNIYSNYTTESFGLINGENVIQELERQAVVHLFSSVYSVTPRPELNSFDAFLSGRYSTGVFMGIMIDTGAANRSTAGQDQFFALQKIQGVKLDSSRAGEAKIQFGIGSTISLGTTEVDTPIGKVVFHIVPADTPFLLSLKDMDSLEAKFDNLDNVLIQKGKRIPIVRVYGHPWMLLDKVKALIHINEDPDNNITIGCHLTEIELRRLHLRFGHPSAERFCKVLQRAGHETNFEEIARLNKFCEQCQIHGKTPSRFKFTLKDDNEFNHTIFVDVFHLDGKPVVQIVDEATSFQNAKFLDNMSPEHAWDTIREAWCDTYIGPPEYKVHDPGTNFNALEFRDNAKMMNIETIAKPVEAHHSIGLVERYHIPLRRAYNIISEEVPNLPKRMKLQMAVKAVNDTAGPDGLVPTLLVFGAYPRMSQDDVPAVSIVARAKAIKKAMADVRRCHAARKVADALNMRNGPNTAHIADLPLNSEVIVFRDGRGWSKPCRLIGMDGQTCQVDINGRLVNFRSTVVKPYYREMLAGTQSIVPNESPSPAPSVSELFTRDNSSKDQNVPRKLRRSARFAQLEFYTPQKPRKIENPGKLNSQIEVFLSEKENRDREISLDLRARGIIKTPGAPFDLSRKKEMDGLLAQGVYKLIHRDAEEIGNTRIFGSRIVDEVKGKESAVPYEKSRLVIQAFNDEGKKLVLTQSPTIQRASQRLIMAIAPSLEKFGIRLFLRDITQAYVQSKTKLARPIYAFPPKEMNGNFPPNFVLKIIRPLYGIPESGTHWFGTYHTHHQQNLEMQTSAYDPCLLVTKGHDGSIGIVAMQTDDTLILGNDKFLDKEEFQLKKARLIASPISSLKADNPLSFNGCKLEIDKNGNGLNLVQKGQGKRLSEIDHSSTNFKQNYIEQRARGAYIASICQPEAAFDCSIAAQHQDPGNEEIKALNKRLLWQMQNLDRGLQYIPLNLEDAKLFVFVDGSFANNPDLSSQIGYVIVLGNENQREGEFDLKGNILHWNSTKCKRITRAVLASELYGMVAGVDMAISISTTLQMITKQLKSMPIPVVVCTDSFSLYECMVKLGTTKEKRLMIDIMAIRQSYERRELSEIRWIEGNSNPADAMTKVNANHALSSLVSSNELTVKVQGWVQRETFKEKI